MDEFLDKMIGKNGPDKRKRFTRAHVVMADDHPDLEAALSTLMFYAMNGPTPELRGGVREVGESCSIMMPEVEVQAINPATGKRDQIIVGDYKLTIERIK